MKIKVGSRKSDLARIQAYAVGKALQALPEVESVEYVFKTSLGDQNQNDPLWQMPEKGVFTQDLTKDLEAKAVDLVVHSWKDLPIEEREKTVIAGTLPRADQRDLLLFRKDRLEKLALEKRARILTSSPRRAYNLGAFLPWALPGGEVEVDFKDVRGNIQTRILKLLESEEADALVVAKAALDRMLSVTESEFKDSWEVVRSALELCMFMVLPLKENPTAAAQGAIAIEARRSDSDLIDLIGKINCSESFLNVSKERLQLQAHGGGCHQKIGISCLSRSYGNIQSLKGLTEKGQKLNHWGLESPVKLEVKPGYAFPVDMSSARLVGDEDIDFDVAALESLNAIFVSKWRAFPEKYEPTLDQLIWVAGLRSWRKLAARGVWVTGSSEAMGEIENPRLENIKGPLKWTKLTHEEALTHSSSDQSFATYRLTDTRVPTDLTSKTHFFWTSFSSFRRAIEAFPEIRERIHCCGPGKTAELIENELKRKPEIFLSFEEWKREII